MSFVGGKLKLKGGDPKGISKKKKKKSTDAAALALATAGSGDAAAAAAEGGAAAGGSKAEPVKTKDGYILPAPSANEDRRTEAQKRHDERVRKLEEERLRKMATKGYRDRVKDFNEHLASLSEHHDIPKVSGSGGGEGGVSLRHSRPRADTDAVFDLLCRWDLVEALQQLSVVLDHLVPGLALVVTLVGRACGNLNCATQSFI
jgi:protein FAM32A